MYSIRTIYIYSLPLSLPKLFSRISEVCDIPLFSDGYIAQHNRGIYKANESTEVFCNTGFEPKTEQITCTSSRMWDPEPICTRGGCVVPAFAGGHYLINGEPTSNSELFGGFITP